MVFPFFGMFCLVPLTFPCLDKLAVAFSFSSECRVKNVECRVQCVLLVVVIIADSEENKCFRP